MFGDIFNFLLETTFTLLGAALLIRAWMHLLRLHPLNNVVRMIFSATDWLILPLKKIFPFNGRLEWVCLMATWLTALFYLILMGFIFLGIALPWSNLLSLFGASFLIVIRWGLNLIVWLTMIQAILSWINPLAPIMPLLHILTAPLLAPIQRLLPRSPIDFSSLVVLILAQIALMIITRTSLYFF